MQYLLKLGISLAVILFCTWIGRRWPSLAGLIATMPLTGLMVLFWLRHDHPGDNALLVRYTSGALWGILPSILFFLVAFVCFRARWPLGRTLLLAFAVWIGGAFVHQWAHRAPPPASPARPSRSTPRPPDSAERE